MNLDSCMDPQNKMILRQILPGERLDKYNIHTLLCMSKMQSKVNF